MARLCMLQISSSPGRWRDVVPFDIDEIGLLGEAEVLRASVELASNASGNKKPSLRILAQDGFDRELMRWEPSIGEWRP
jgi:hypothetical protein